MQEGKGPRVPANCGAMGTGLFGPCEGRIVFSARNAYSMRFAVVFFLAGCVAGCHPQDETPSDLAACLEMARTPDDRVSLLITAAEPLWTRRPDSATVLLVLADAEPRTALRPTTLRRLIAARMRWASRTKDTTAVGYGLGLLREIGDTDELSRAAAERMLALAYATAGLFTQADSLLEHSVEVTERKGDTTAVVDGLLERMRTTLMTGRPTLALAIAERVERQCMGASDSTVRARFLLNRANARAQVMQMDSALADLRRAGRISAAVHDSVGMVSSGAMLGSYLTFLGRLDEASGALLEAYSIAERIGDEHLIAPSAFNLALVYKQTKQYAAAVPLLERAWHLAEAIGKRDLTPLAYGARAVLWGEADSVQARVFGIPERKRYDTALVVLKEALLQVERTGNIQWVGVFEATIAEVLISKQMPDMAEPHAVRAEEITRMIGDQHMQAIAVHTLADIAFARGEWRRSLELYERAGAIDEALGLQENAAYVLDRKSRALAELGRLPEAFATGRAALDAHKAYLSKENVTALARGEERAAASRQQLADSLRAAQRLADERDQRTIAELGASRNRATAWGVGGFALLALGGGAFAWRTQRKRRDAEAAQALALADARTAGEKRRAAEFQNAALRAQMDEHFISNTLNAVNAHLYTDHPDAASDLLARFAQWIRSMLENSQHAAIPLKDDMEALRVYLELQRMRLGGCFDFTVQVDPAIEAERVMVPPLLVQPLLENAIEHGVGPMGTGGHITLSAYLREGALVLSVEDNGVGRRAAPVADRGRKKSSLSTGIIREQLRLLRERTGHPAELRTIDLPRGTRVEVLLPR